MADYFRVDFVDGSSVTVARRPVHMMRAERIVGASAGAHEQVLATLWAAVTGGSGSKDEFDHWADSVDDWRRSEDGADDPPADGSVTTQT